MLQKFSPNLQLEYLCFLTVSFVESKFLLLMKFALSIVSLIISAYFVS